MLDAKALLDLVINLGDEAQADLGAGLEAIKLFRDRMFPTPVKASKAASPALEKMVSSFVSKAKSGS